MVNALIRHLKLPNWRMFRRYDRDSEALFDRKSRQGDVIESRKSENKGSFIPSLNVQEVCCTGEEQWQGEGEGDRVVRLSEITSALRYLLYLMRHTGVVRLVPLCMQDRTAKVSNFIESSLHCNLHHSQPHHSTLQKIQRLARKIPSVLPRQAACIRLSLPNQPSRLG